MSSSTSDSFAKLFGGAQPRAEPPFPNEPLPPLPPVRPEVQRRFQTNDLRITRIYFPKEEDIKKGAPTFAIFRGTCGGAKRKWKGVLPTVDRFHEYSVEYEVISDKKPYEGKICSISRWISFRRAPLDRRTLKIILRDVVELPAGQRRAIENQVFSDDCLKNPRASPHGNLALFLRKFGNSEWLKEAESGTNYFRDWYEEQLCPPYEHDDLAFLSPATVHQLVRHAVSEPWKLACWWMTTRVLVDALLLKELNVRDVELLATKFGGNFPVTARLAIEAYRSRPFGKARGRADSYVLKSAFEGCAPGTLAACLQHGIVLRPGAAAGSVEERVRCAGDARLERLMAELVVKRVTDPEEPPVAMKPRSAWWPWKDPEAPQPTAEQQEAIEAGLHSRWHQVCGDPGTGKTSVVMRSMMSAFSKHDVLAIAPTGMAAQNQKQKCGSGITAHRVIAEYKHSVVTGREFKFANKRVMFVEEAWALSLRVLLANVLVLPGIARIYLFGDNNQLRPPDGGPSLGDATLDAYADQSRVVSRLTQSMRITDPTGILMRNLHRICACSLQGFEWAADPASGHPFVFLQRGNSPAENVDIIRDALWQAGVDPDSNRMQIMVRTNKMVAAIGKAWFAASPIGSGKVFAEHDFYLGERVMFLNNANRTTKLKDSSFRHDKVCNGTNGTITKIFDENPDGKEDAVVQLPSTFVPKAKPFYRRWIVVDTASGEGLVMVLLDSYGKQNIARIPPLTVDKMQGLETEYAIFLLTKEEKDVGGRGKERPYSATSRAARATFVVADFCAEDPTLPCPSREFTEMVAASKDQPRNSDFWTLFPPCDEIADKIAVDPEACVKKKKRRSEESDEEEEDEEEVEKIVEAPKRKRLRHMS